MTNLRDDLARRLDAARKRAVSVEPAAAVAEIGIVQHVADGVATISGLDSARLDELLAFDNGARALAISLDPESIGAMLLDPEEGIAAGTKVRATGEVIQVPVGDGLLGRVVDPLGRPRDLGKPPQTSAMAPIERPAPQIVDRQEVTEPLYTGVLAIDSMIPLGRGQRELLIGDRSIGKTALAVDAILNQKHSDVICVYAAVGQKLSSIGNVIDTVRHDGPFERTIFVIAEADDPPGLQWIAPYAACTMAEYFRDRGQHALLIVDDLSKHAAIHRQISLLLRNPPGREAYPGDIFHIHARLLERAAKLSDELGGGSLTALPIAETQAGNIAAYIPTNLISITDGQIYLESKLFHENQKPAINVGLSVSRVGGKTQSQTVAALSESLKLDYATFLELEIFTRFGHMMDERTTRTIEHGRRIRAILQQPRSSPLRVSTLVALLTAANEGVLDKLALDRLPAFKETLEAALADECPGMVQRLEAGAELTDEDRANLRTWLERYATRFGAPLMEKADGTAGPA